MKHHIYILFISLILISCGGGSNSTNSIAGSITYKGQFVDAPVMGLIYTASPSGLSGITDINGEFKFKAGDKITFSISTPVGSLHIGTYSPDTIIDKDSTSIAFVLTLENGIQVAQVLQSLGGSGSSLDVSINSPTVSSLTSADIQELSSFISSPLDSLRPAKVTVDAQSAQYGALASINNITSNTSKKISEDLFLNRSFFLLSGQKFLSDLLQPMALDDIKDTSFLYFSDSNIGSTQCFFSTSLKPSSQFVTRVCPTEFETWRWSVNTIESSINMIFNDVGNLSQNLVIKYFDASIFSFSEDIYAANTLIGNGYGLLIPITKGFSLNNFSNKSIMFEGDSACNKGIIKYTFNSNGAAYTKSCKYGTSNNQPLLYNSGMASNNSRVPDVVTFTDDGAPPENVLHIGLISGTTKGGKVIASTTGNDTCTNYFQSSCSKQFIVNMNEE